MCYRKMVLREFYNIARLAPNGKHWPASLDRLELPCSGIPPVPFAAPDRLDGLPVEPQPLHLLAQVVGGHDLVVVDPAVAVPVRPVHPGHRHGTVAAAGGLAGNFTDMGHDFPGK